MKSILLSFLILLPLLFITPVFPQVSLQPLNPDFYQAIQNQDQNDKAPENVGGLPFPVKLGYAAHKHSNTNFPAYYDLRNLGVLPPVKSQSAGGCWAYSTMSTVESRMLVLGQPLYNLSDNNLKYCHGFFDSRSTNGNAWMSTAYFARQSGPLLEAQDPYPGGTTLPNTDCPVGEAPAFFIRDSRYPPGDMATIKQLVMDVGSIWSLLYYEGTFFNDANDTYYYGGDHDVNHVLNVVGWDDNKATAGGTGAWICQNTYGSAWGEGGFVYVSYNDSSFLEYNAYFPTFDYYNDDSRVLLYDELGNYGSIGYGSDIAYALVKYQLPENLFLEQIGTYAMAEATQIEMEIYKNFDEGTGQLSNLLSTVSTRTTGHPGFYTFNLDAQFPLNAGEVIYIKVKYNTPGYGWPIPCEYFIPSYANPHIESDVAWVSLTGTAGEWAAIGATTTSPYDLCINVYGKYNPITFNVAWTGASSSQWNTAANWNPNSVPIASDNIEIFDVVNDPVIESGTGANCNNLSINLDANLTVESGGSFITHGTIYNNGNINIEKAITNDVWHFVSSPIEDATSIVFAGNYLQSWYEPTANWIEIISTSVDLTPGKGFSLWGIDKTSNSYTFTGTPNTGNVPIDISFTEVPDSTNDGANLLGNPYPSSIDWEQVDGYGAVYYWNEDTYVAYPDTLGYGTGSQYVPPMQGFFIVVTDEILDSFVFTNEMRTHTGSENYYKSDNYLTNGILIAAVTGEKEDLLVIRENPEALEAFDFDKDALKLKAGISGKSEIWSIAFDAQLSIDVRNNLQTIPLGFSNNQSGVYQIQLNDIDGISHVQIEDTKLNHFHNLLNGAYQFNWNSSDSEERFILHLKATGIVDLETQVPQVFAFAGRVYICTNDSKLFTQMAIYDISGRLILEKSLSEESHQDFELKQPQGAYLVQLKGETDAKSYKIIL